MSGPRSNVPNIRSSPNLRVLPKDGPTSEFDTFLNRAQSGSGSRLAERVGSTQGDIDLQAQEPNWRAVMRTAEVTGVEDSRDKPALLTALEFIARPGSAMAGYMSGIRGETIYRPGETPDEVPLGGRTETARRRASEGIRGDEFYSWSYVGPTAKRISEEESFPGYAGAANLAKGIVLDTVFDPITYVSFGGSIMGRSVAARRVSSEANRLLRRHVEDAAFDAETFLRANIAAARAPVSARGVTNRYQNIARRQASNEELPEAVRDIYARAKFPLTNNVDDVFNQARLVDDAVFDWYDKFDVVANFKRTPWARETALEIMPDIAASQYHLRSAAGLRRWANQTFGEDVGEQFFRSLSYDIQGGIRMRLPFIRSLDGSPLATKPIFGAGRLGDGLEKIGIKTLNQFWNATEAFRDGVRGVVHAVPGSGHLMFKGRAGEQLADALLGATGKRYRFFYNDEGSFKLFGRKVGAYVDYVDYAAFDKGVFKAMGRAQHFNSRQAERHYVAVATLNGSLANKTKAEQERIADTFWDYLGDRARLDKDWETYAQGGALRPSEEAALRPAYLFGQMMDDYGAEAVAITKDSKMAVGFLNNYATRRQTATTRFNRYQESRVGAGPEKSGVDSALRQRGNDVEVWDLSVDGPVRLMYKGPHKIFKMTPDGVYRKEYIDDPVAAMADYINNVQRTLDDLRIAQVLDDSGIWTRDQVRRFVSHGEEIINEDLVVLVGSRSGKIPGRIQELRKRLIDDFDLLDDNGRVVRRVEDMKQRDIEELGSFLAEEATFKGAVSPHAMHRYNAVQGKNGVFENPIDGTRLVERAGVYELIDHRGVKVLDENGVPYVFNSKAAAEIAIRETPELLAKRIALYNNKVSVDIANLLHVMDDTFRMRPRQWGNLFSQIDEKHAAGLIDDVTHNGMKEALLRRAFENLEYMGMGQEKRALIEGTTQTRVVREGALSPEYKTLDNIINYAERNKLSNINDVRYGRPDPLSTKKDVQAKILTHLGDVYAPEATARSVARMFEVYRNSDKIGGRIWNDIYLPYFAMIKSQLTLLRGPGFVARNLLGGSYNNFINDVGRMHHLASGEVITARLRAQKQFRKKYGDNWYLRDDLDPNTVQFEVQELFIKNLRSKYGKSSGTFIEGKNDAEALVELWSAAFDNGAVGASRSTRLATEIGAFGPTTRGSAWGVTTTKQRNDILGGYVETLGSGAANVDVIKKSDQKLLARGFAKLGTDNIVVRKFMGPLQSTSEDYMRFAAYLKGVQELGLEPLETGLRGYGAAQWVKATQFDYSDLSHIEQAFFKNIAPFYIWTRNNIPLQLRAFIHNPARIQTAFRIHRNLGLAFGEDDMGPLPDYTAMSMMNVLPDRVTEKLPDWLRPHGRVGFGPAHMDPMVDANRWFQIPAQGRRLNPTNYINKREFFQNLNPLINTVHEAFVAPLNQGVDYEGRGYSDAPGWARTLARIPGGDNIPGLTRRDYADSEQPVEINRRARNVITSALPIMQHAERYLSIPGVLSVGDERQQGRWLTTMASAIAGLPFATIDDYQYAGQMQRDTARVMRYLEEEFGETANTRKEMVKRLIDRGAPLEFIESLELANLPRDEVDVLRAQHAWEFYRWSIESIANGYPEEDILAIAWAYGGEGSGSSELANAIWEAIPGMAERGFSYRPAPNARRVTPTTDRNALRRMFEQAPPTKLELEILGYTPIQISRMSDDDKIIKIMIPLLDLRDVPR